MNESIERVRATRHRSRPGAPPGTLVSHYEGDSSIEVIAYGKTNYATANDIEIDDLARFEEFDVVWVNVIGLADIQLIRTFGDIFGIHQLTLEDIVNVHQRAKFESFDNYDYIVTRMPRFEDEVESMAVLTEQLSIVVVGRYVFTFQIVQADCLDPVRRRIKDKSGLIRERGPDYLVYALIDSVVDHYFPILDRLSDCVADFDESLLSEDAPISVKEIHQLRRELLNLSRHVRPHREMVARLLRDPSCMTDQTRLFLGDCFDHILQLSESIDLNREVCSDLRSYHLALVGNRTNDVMKTLTIVSTIFIPLSFIAGLYGMNFDNMPELKWKYGYMTAILAMLVVASGLLLWFRTKGWFRN